MTARFRTLDELPLFASDEDLSAALMGAGKTTAFRSVVPLLEADGFPKMDALMGGRYTPAVKAFFDREYRLAGDGRPVAPRDGPEALGTWKNSRKAGRPA
jgi:hypothetical protein